MNNRVLIFSLIILFFLITVEIQAQIRQDIYEAIVRTKTFDSLSENEHLAYKIVRRDEQNVLQLYAQEINNQENVRLIGEWHPVSNTAVQFTNSRRSCFFIIWSYFLNSKPGSLFHYNGNSGEVRHILEISPDFRVSRDGKFLVFNLIDLHDTYHNVQLYQGRFIPAVWSIDSQELLSVFDWTVNKNWGGGFTILMDKNDNIMNIYYVMEGGKDTAAHAVIHLDTLQFEVLWDITDKIVWGKTDIPRLGRNEYQYDSFIDLMRVQLTE